MSKLTTLPTKEIETISKQFSADTGYTYNEKLLHTVDDCVEQYKKAEEVSRIAQAVIKDRMQGSALLKAKKIICGDEWNSRKLSNIISKKWLSFCETLGQIDRSGNQTRNISYLLDFAGYKEAEERLIEAGVDVTPIDTASHYREVKKLSELDSHEAVATTYTQAVEANNGEIPSTAKEVKEVVNTSKNKVNSMDLFLSDFPEYIGIEPSHNKLKVDDIISSKLPRPSKDKWKHFYKIVASSIHPDKGGTDDDMAILTGIKEVYDYLHQQDKQNMQMSEKTEKYREWCESKGCSMYAWIEDEGE